MSNGLVFA